VIDCKFYEVYKQLKNT